MSRENTRLLTRAWEERARTVMPVAQLAYVPLGGVPAFAEPDIYLLPRVLPTVADD